MGYANTLKIILGDMESQIKVMGETDQPQTPPTPADPLRPAGWRVGGSRAAAEKYKPLFEGIHNPQRLFHN